MLGEIKMTELQMMMAKLEESIQELRNLDSFKCDPFYSEIANQVKELEASLERDRELIAKYPGLFN